MIALVRLLARGGSRRERVRGRLMSAGAALATFMLCAAVNLLGFEIDVRDDFLGVFTSREPRLVTSLTLALLTLPAAGFAYQVSRLGAATRERRLAALRLAGATPREVRRIGAYDGGWRALQGALVGGGLYLLLNLVLWWSLDGIVPLISPLWALVVLAVVVSAGVLSGARAGRHVVASPLGLVRQARVRGPRILDLVLVVLGFGTLMSGLILKGGFPVLGPIGAGLAMAFGAALLLIGLVLAATLLIRAVAHGVGRRARTPETLVAARMVEVDPRAWARALAVVALTVYFGAAVGAQQSIIIQHDLNTSKIVIYTLVFLALLVALVISAAALVVHQAEELLDHRRSFAALNAAGAPVTALGRALTRQALIAALPVCAGAAVAGALTVSLTALELNTAATIAYTAFMTVVMATIGVTASVLVARAARPILRRALLDLRVE